MTNDQYDPYVAEFERKNQEKEMRKTVYVSRRAIWVNALIALLISPLGAYIYTRRWKALGLFTLASVVVFGIIGEIDSKPNETFEESMARSFERGVAFSPLASLIVTIENGLAIRRARQKMQHSGDQFQLPGNKT
jgi:hypothetical protein